MFTLWGRTPSRGFIEKVKSHGCSLKKTSFKPKVYCRSRFYPFCRLSYCSILLFVKFCQSYTNDFLQLTNSHVNWISPTTLDFSFSPNPENSNFIALFLID